MKKSDNLKGGFFWLTVYIYENENSVIFINASKSGSFEKMFNFLSISNRP